MPGGIGDCAAMPRPLAKMEMNSSKSTAMAMAWRRLRALSELQCESLRLSPLMELLAIRLGWDTSPAKSLVIPPGEGWGGGGLGKGKRLCASGVLSTNTARTDTLACLPWPLENLMALFAR